MTVKLEGVDRVALDSVEVRLRVSLLDRERSTIAGCVAATDFPLNESRGDFENEFEVIMVGDAEGRFPIEMRRKCLPEALGDIDPGPRDESEADKVTLGVSLGPFPDWLDMAGNWVSWLSRVQNQRAGGVI